MNQSFFRSNFYDPALLPFRFFSGKSIKILAAVTVLVLSNFVSYAQTVEDNPIPIFNEGQAAHEKGEFQTALKLYEKALEIMPEFPEAEYQRGNVLLSLKNVNEAEHAFRNAIALRENWALAMTALGALLVQKNQFAEADQLLTRSIQLSGIDYLAFSALAELRLKTNAAPEILRPLLTKIQYFTTKAFQTSGLWASRASLERALGDLNSASDSLNRAIALDPLDKLALSERVEISLVLGDHERAIADSSRLLKLSPNSPSVQFLIAKIHAAKGELEKSLKILSTIESLTAEMVEFRDKIDSFNSTNFNELEAKLVNDEKNTVVLGRLCVLLRIENPEKALDYCRRASELEPSNLEHAAGFGAALVQVKKYDHAINLFKRLLEISPDHFTAHTNLATAYFQAQRFTEAKSEYLWILKRQPDLVIAYYLLAISHDRLEEYLDAAANYQQFLRIAEPAKNQLEIDKVNLRLPILQRQIKQGKGKRNE